MGPPFIFLCFISLKFYDYKYDLDEEYFVAKNDWFYPGDLEKGDLNGLWYVKKNKKIAFKLNVMDIPNESRKFHTKPVPLTGGLFILLAFLIDTLSNYIKYNSISDDQIYLTILFFLESSIMFLFVIYDYNFFFLLFLLHPWWLRYP